MGKYLFKRLLHGLVSVIAVVAIVMILIYSLMDRIQIFNNDTLYSKQSHNAKEVYTYRKWEEYGYLDYVPYADYLTERVNLPDGDPNKITEEIRAEAVVLPKKMSAANDTVKKYVAEFTAYYESQGYTVVQLDAKTVGNKLAAGGGQQLFAWKDKPLITRLWSYFTGLFTVDNINNATGDVGERGITFTLFDPYYGGDTFAPAIIGNGTTHKYLLYVDNQFPYIHQNLLTLNLGKSYSINSGVDVFQTMTESQGSYVKAPVIYPTGLQTESADNLHTATYVEGSRELLQLTMDRYTDDYTNVKLFKNGMSQMEYSFVIGIISVIAAYLIGLPLGVVMARKKGKLLDKLGTVYIVFLIAVPSLAYIFMFQAIGGRMGLPTFFNLDQPSKLMYILPIVSLALPSVASLMKWLRRYMIDQMNSDYVKFARSGGLSENEIFTKHILKNALIPIVHGIPGSILGALVGAIITERVYSVPGVGGVLTNAISAYDNGVIVGITLFYALLSIISLILGDILMALVDPRISFSSKAR